MKNKNVLENMNHRSREVFRTLVETYLKTGVPIGSRVIAKSIKEKISSSTVRNIMKDFEQLGLLGSSHVSAGRVPTETGLRLFVDGILEISEMNESLQVQIENSIKNYSENNFPIHGALDRVGSILSGLTEGASLVLTPKIEAPIKHLEFVSLSSEKVLVVIVMADGQVENRIFNSPKGLTYSAMKEASNFLNHVLEGRTISEIRKVINEEIDNHKAELDDLSRNLIESGVAIWVPDALKGRDRLIVRGRANLLNDSKNGEDLERIKTLFDDLERKRDLEHLLDLTQESEGVKIFIGSENKLFSLSGSTLVISPYMNSERRVIGAVGVIGPTRLNYGKIVPIVDYTAQIISKTISDRAS